MWKDYTTGQAGNIYKLICINEGLADAKAAYKRCEELFGKAPKVQKTAQQKAHRKFERQRTREYRFKRTQKQYEEENSLCQRRRQWIEAKMIENLAATGSFFKSLAGIPVQVGHDKQGKIKYFDMTSANYMHAMLLENEDPRYMSAGDIKKEGWKVKENAVPVDFEYLEAKDEPFHLVTWKMYNAKDIIGIPPQAKTAPLSKENVMHNIQTMIESNGETANPEATMASLLQQLRKVASDHTWHDALVLGQRALERELTMTRLLQQAGVTTNYKIKDGTAVLEHLERDQNRKNAKNLFRSGYRMDQAVRSIREEYTKATLKQILAEAKAIKEQAANPFHMVSIHVRKDFMVRNRENREMAIPAGAVIQGEQAYQFLHTLLHEDKRLFEATHDPMYQQEVSLDVAVAEHTYPVHMKLGNLQTGNTVYVSEALQQIILQDERDQVYRTDRREAAIDAKIKANVFYSSEFRYAYEKAPKLCREKMQWVLEAAYQKKEAEVRTILQPLQNDEVLYRNVHPELKKEKADIYRYLVPAQAFANTEEVRRAYESDLVLDIKKPDFYGSKAEGYVIETRGPLISRENGFYAVGKPAAENITVQPFLTQLEEQAQRRFETFTVEITSNEQVQAVYHGDEAKEVLAWKMIEAREVFEQETRGVKPVELSAPEAVKISWGDQMLAEKEISLGNLELGNCRNVRDAIHTLAGESSALKELDASLRVSEKYTAARDISELLDMYQPLAKEAIEKTLSRSFEPAEMEDCKPKVGQKASKAMQWYEAKAKVNGCAEPQAICQYMVQELAQKYKEDTVKRWVTTYLPKYREYVDDSLKQVRSPANVPKKEETRNRKRESSLSLER